MPSGPFLIVQQTIAPEHILRRYHCIRQPERSALTGRASPLRGSDGFYALSPVLYSAACIFHALPDFSSPPMMAGTDPAKNSANASRMDPACSPAVPPVWEYAATAVHQQTAPTAASSARAASQRPAAPASSKPPSNGWRSRTISSLTATGSTSLSSCPTFCGPFSTTTGSCSMRCSRHPPAACYGGPANRMLRSASSAPCIDKADSLTSIRTFTSLLPAAVSISGMASGAISSLKSTP